MHRLRTLRIAVCGCLLAAAPAAAQIYVAPQPGDAIRYVRVSIKIVTDENGERPANGHYITDDQLALAIDESNQALENMGADWRLQLLEIVEADGISQWYGPWPCEHKNLMEVEAEENPALFRWRTDAINIYVINELGNCGGYCSYPAGGAEIIVINNSDGILNWSLGWLHEIGHYFNVYHTYQCQSPLCDDSNRECTGAGGPSLPCDDVCPDANNIMGASGNLTPETGIFTRCQLQIMANEMHPVTGRRRHVVSAPVDPEPIPDPDCAGANAAADGEDSPCGDVPPQVLIIDAVRVDPLDAAVDSLNIVFSEPMDTISVDPRYGLILAREGRVVNGTMSWSNVGRQLTWTPSSPLEPGTYRLWMAAGPPDGFSDLAGHPLGANSASGFFELTFSILPEDANASTQEAACGGGMPMTVAALAPLMIAARVRRRRRR